MLSPRFKLFLWPACMGCLSVLEVLRGRGMCLNSMCPVCNQEPEMVFHALISCSKVSTYFVNSNLDVNVFGTSSLVDFFLTRVPHLSKEKASAFRMILWTIWKKINAKRWYGNSLSPLVAIQ